MESLRIGYTQKKICNNYKDIMSNIHHSRIQYNNLINGGAIRYVENVLKMPTPETRWGKEARIAEENTSAEDDNSS